MRLSLSFVLRYMKYVPQYATRDSHSTFPPFYSAHPPWGLLALLLLLLLLLMRINANTALFLLLLGGLCIMHASHTGGRGGKKKGFLFRLFLSKLGKVAILSRKTHSLHMLWRPNLCIKSCGGGVLYLTCIPTLTLK